MMELERETPRTQQGGRQLEPGPRERETSLGASREIRASGPQEVPEDTGAPAAHAWPLTSHGGQVILGVTE